MARQIIKSCFDRNVGFKRVLSGYYLAGSPFDSRGIFDPYLTIRRGTASVPPPGVHNRRKRGLFPVIDDVYRPAEKTR